MVSPYIVPVAIIIGAVIGFFAAWYNSLLNRQAGEITLRVNEVCQTLDQLKIESIKYWTGDDDKNPNIGISIKSIFHSVGLQLVYLNTSLKVFSAPWWKCNSGKDNEIKLKLVTEYNGLHNLITGDDFDVVTEKKNDPDRCQRIATKIERFKFNIRTFRERY